MYALYVFTLTTPKQKALLLFDADLEAKNAHGRTPLEEAESAYVTTFRRSSKLFCGRRARSKIVTRLLALAPLELSVLEVLAVISFSLTDGEDRHGPSEIWRWNVAVLVQDSCRRISIASAVAQTQTST